MSLAVPTLQQLKLLQPPQKADASKPGCQGLLDLLLQQQGSLLDGSNVRLLLLLVEPTKHSSACHVRCTTSSSNRTPCTAGRYAQQLSKPAAQQAFIPG